jgi:hypothetical protein
MNSGQTRPSRLVGQLAIHSSSSLGERVGLFSSNDNTLRTGSEKPNYRSFLRWQTSIWASQRDPLSAGAYLLLLSIVAYKKRL